MHDVLKLLVNFTIASSSNTQRDSYLFNLWVNKGLLLVRSMFEGLRVCGYNVEFAVSFAVLGVV